MIITMEKKQVLAPEKLWTKAFCLIIIVNCFTYIGTFMLLSTLPLLALEIGASKLTAGLVTGIYSLTGFVSRLKIGILLDQRGRLSMLFFGLGVVLLVTIFYNIAAYSVILLLILRAVHGVGWSISTTTSSTIVSDIIPADRRTEGLGFFGISISVAMIIGPGLGLYIMEHYHYELLFGISACFIILALLLSVYQKYYYQAQPATTKQVNKSVMVQENKKVASIEKTALWPSFLFFIIVMTYSTIMIFLPLYAHDRNVTDIGMFFTIIALAMMVTRLTMGKIADWYGTTKVLVPGMLLLAIALQLLFVATSLQMFLLAAIFYGFGYGIVQPALNALALSRAPKERRGATNATFLCAMDMGGILGSVIWGFVSETFGFAYIYSISAILIILAIMMHIVAIRKDYIS